ncbi:hypothetical protein GY45DRAFT_642885 [Cubamyces sp. BRFM 1775]|nr:hypothetical protein GY45DRAFT_642885 [Cubamyces sp. BRFM 1775]
MTKSQSTVIVCWEEGVPICSCVVLLFIRPAARTRYRLFHCGYHRFRNTYTWTAILISRSQLHSIPATQWQYDGSTTKSSLDASIARLSCGTAVPRGDWRTSRSCFPYTSSGCLGALQSTLRRARASSLSQMRRHNVVTRLINLLRRLHETRRTLPVRLRHDEHKGILI